MVLIGADMHTIDKGSLITRNKDITEFPEIYKLLPPESEITSYVGFYFVKGDDIEDSVMQYDAFLYARNWSRAFAPAPQIADIWLYKDLTAYYQNKYPEANVKAVVIRYMVKIL